MILLCILKSFFSANRNWSEWVMLIVGCTFRFAGEISSPQTRETRERCRLRAEVDTKSQVESSGHFQSPTREWELCQSWTKSSETSFQLTKSSFDSYFLSSVCPHSLYQWLLQRSPLSKRTWLIISLRMASAKSLVSFKRWGKLIEAIIPTGCHIHMPTTLLGLA